MNDFILSQNLCYSSTPEHIKSFIGRFIYIYTAKGSIFLTKEDLQYKNKKKNIVIPIKDITHIEIGHYSRIAKPIQLNYLSVTYKGDSAKNTILFTPTISWTTPIWKTNKIVQTWMDALTNLQDHSVT